MVSYTPRQLKREKKKLDELLDGLNLDAACEKLGIKNTWGTTGFTPENAVSLFIEYLKKK